MIRELTAGMVLLGLSACASAPPDPAASVPPAAQSAAAPHGEPAASPAGTAAAGHGEADGESGLHVVEVPSATPAPPQPVAASEPHEDEVICKRIRVTGSHRLQRVCRTRAEIDAAREAGQAMHRSVTSAPSTISSQ